MPDKCNDIHYPAKKPVVDESLCVDCNACIKYCPHCAIEAV
ncbi:MAG: 4Fe-4S binding protein [Methanosarcinaceae archaeon]